MKMILNWAIALLVVAFVAIIAFGPFGPDAEVTVAYNIILLAFISVILVGLFLMRIGLYVYEGYSTLTPDEKAKADKYSKRAAGVVADHLKKGEHKGLVEGVEKILRD